MLAFFVDILVILGFVTAPCTFTDPELTAMVNAHQEPIVQYVAHTGEGEQAIESWNWTSEN